MENENEKKTKTLEDVMDSVADLLAESAGAAEKVADLEKRIANLEAENKALRNDRARLRKERNESHALLNGIVLAIAKFKCRNPSIN